MPPHRWAPHPYQRAETRAIASQQPRREAAAYHIYTISLTPIRHETRIRWCYVTFRDPRDAQEEADRLKEHFPNCAVYQWWLQPQEKSTVLKVEFPRAVMVAELLAVAEKLWGG